MKFYTTLKRVINDVMNHSGIFLYEVYLPKLELFRHQHAVKYRVSFVDVAAFSINTLTLLW